MDVFEIAADLANEQNQLDDIVASLEDGQWRLETPSPGWTITDQIAHLTYFDRAAATAITEPKRFRQLVADLAEAAAEGSEAVDRLTLEPYRSMPPADLLDAWRAGRSALARAARQLADGIRVEWYGPSMGAKSFLTARLMEVWAHGRDIADAAGVTHPATDRLRHIAQLGFITRGWSYVNRGLEPPADPVRVELTAPSGGLWEFGPDDAVEYIVGPAEDFCLVVTQRRHVDDTALMTTTLGREWMLNAQAFAGPPTEGPAPGTRP